MWNETFSDAKPAILERWRELIAGTYPEQTGRFLRREENEFRNPVGATILRDTEAMLNAVSDNADADAMRAAVENLARIRAVQEFSAGDAVSFVFLLKSAVRESMAPRLDRVEFVQGLLELESRIDRLALAAFETYLECREKILDIRVNNVNRQVFKLLERHNIATPGGVRRHDKPPDCSGGCSC